MPQSNTPETWIKKLDASEKRHLTRVRELRRDILADESLGDLDRAVLGMTGSQEKLTEYQDLARKIGAQAGQPIISIEAFDEGEVRRAKAGIIDGDLKVGIKRYYERDSGELLPEDTSAELSVPVSPIVSYAWHKHGHPYRSPDNFFFDKQTTGQDMSGGDMVIARFSHHEYRNKTTNPENDIHNSQSSDVLLIGRKDIYTHEWFSQGIGKILLALEKYSVTEKTA